MEHSSLIVFKVLLLFQIAFLYAQLSQVSGEATASIVISPVSPDNQHINGCAWNDFKIECDSLEHALNGIQHIQSHNNSLTIDIPLGHYTLGKMYTFKNKTGMCFNGTKGPGVPHDNVPIVKCDSQSNEGGGIGFQYSTNISIIDITFIGCGALQNGTSNDWTDDNAQFSVALYFHSCKEVYISGVRVLNTTGTGMIIFNTAGVNNIKDSDFNNSVSNGLGKNFGGSGVHIEFVPTTNTDDEESIASYNLSDVMFGGNSASSGIYQLSHVTNKMNSLLGFGMGGGLSLYFGPYSASNTITINRCIFSNNFANQGGGLSIIFLQNSQQNSITVTNSSFQYNNCTTQEVPPTKSSQGGGMAVKFLSGSHNNTVHTATTNFTDNVAFYGGGLSMQSGLLNNRQNGILTESQRRNTFEVSECAFTRNSARVGAAMDLYCQNPVEIESVCSTMPKITNTNFTHNKGKYVYEHNKMGKTFTTLNIQYIPVFFQENINFLSNNASGLGLQQAVVEMKEQSTLTFSENKGKVGGGMVLLGLSTVILNSHCQVFFTRNSATERGGAVFASQTQERYIAYDYSCFFRHFNWYTHPDYWSDDNISISFSNNTILGRDGSALENAIFVSSLLPCVWPSNLTSNSDSDIASTFCDWKSWHFDSDNDTSLNGCKDQIRTLPAGFNQTSYHLSAFPGQTVPFTNLMEVFDDFHHNIVHRTTFTGLLVDRQDLGNEVDLQVSGNGTLRIYGDNNVNHTVDIILQTNDERSILTKLLVEIDPCPPGTNFNNSECTCPKHENRFKGNLQCQKNVTNPDLPFNVLVFDGHCISYRKRILNDTKSNSTELLVARCPYLAGDICPNGEIMRAYRVVPNKINATEFEQDFCKPANRRGPLCGKCIDNYDIDIFSSNYKCVKCKNPLARQWTMAALFIVVPITIFFLIVTIFHIGVTSASANGYIFFSHVISIPLNALIIESAWNIIFQHNSRDKGKALTTTLFIPYRIWSLEFAQIFFSVVKTNLCLAQFKAIHILLLHYTNAVYALLLVFVTYIVIELHARNYRPLVCLWKPLCFLCVRFRRNWEMRTSVIDAFATVLLLSYSKLVGVSISLLAPSSVLTADGKTVERVLHYDTTVVFFSKEHKPFAAVAIIVLLTVGVVPPFLLLLYPFQWFQKLLNICHLNRHSLAVFMDAFQGNYKNRANNGVERRYFAAFYFIFRIIINVLFILPMTLPGLYTTLSVTYAVLLITVVVLRPYKNNFYNNLDAVFITILVVTNCLIAYCLIYAIQFGSIPYLAWIPTYTLSHLPTLYMIGFCVYWICSRSRLFQAHCIPQCLRVQDRIRYFRNNYDQEDEGIGANYRILTSPTSPSHSHLLESDQFSSSKNFTQSDSQNVSNDHEDDGSDETVSY